MKLITPPDIDSFDVFTNIKNSKRNNTHQLLDEISEKVRSRYEEYSQKNQELSEISCSTINSDFSIALLHCYNVETNELNRLKANIDSNYQKAVGIKCQFCEIDNISTYDHYLPKEEFPDYSVHVPNLIPCCSRCNNLKRNHFINELNEREIINIYFESLPRERFLYCNFSINNRVPNFVYYLQESISVSDSMFRLIRSHFDRLNLLERCKSISHSTFSETKRSLIKHSPRTNSGKYIKNWLIDEAEVIQEEYSINNWKVSYYFALADSDDFIASCMPEI